MKTINQLFKILLTFLLVWISLTVNAAFFKNLPYSVIQPDGKVINCFVSGDEFFNWLHDINDYTIIQGNNGYYFYATYDNDKNIIASAFLVNSVDPANAGLEKNVRISDKEYQERVTEYFKYVDKSSKAPHTGTLNNLAVYIRFSDDTEFSNIRQIYDTKLNSPTPKSLLSYFKEVSYTALTISSSHYPVCPLTTNLSYQDSHPRAYYQPYNAQSNPIGYTDDNRTEREHTLLVNAINFIAAQVPVGLNIDGDNDGKVDNVCFIIKGTNGAWANLLWAHRWSLYSQTVNINGKRVYDYTFQPESQVDVQTLCHEMFHALGAPDLYHYSYDGFAPAGDWDLMESGYGHMGAFMKYKYTNHTWIADIPEITASGTYTLKPITSSTNNCYKIISPNSPTEYFVLEYRVKEGVYESSIPGTGLLIYRINPAAGNGNAQGPPDEVYIYRPGGTPTTNGSIGNATFSQNSGRTQFNNISDPKCFYQDGSLAGLDIYDIGTTGTTISFKVGYNLKPNANFTANKTTIKELETINFTNLSSGNPTSSIWNFGNGITSTELNPMNIQFSNTGDYTVSLVSTNPFGSDTMTKQNFIHVNPSLLNCTNAVNITFGLPYIGNTSSGQSNVNKYNCKTWSENGPEMVHTITTKSVGTIRAELSNLSSDLDIFLLSSCKENSCVAGAGNSITYENAPAGTYYIVVDGNYAGNYTLTVSYSQTKIDEIYTNEYLSIFPNPNNGFFKLKLKDDNNLNTQSSLKIFSSIGKIVYADAYTFNEGEIEINLSFLTDGMYFIQVLLQNGEKYNGKIVIKK